MLMIPAEVELARAGTCPTCKGKGQEDKMYGGGPNGDPEVCCEITCRACKGTGKTSPEDLRLLAMLDANECPQCHLPLTKAAVEGTQWDKLKDVGQCQKHMLQEILQLRNNLAHHKTLIEYLRRKVVGRET